MSHRRDRASETGHLDSARSYFSGRPLYDDMLADIECAAHTVCLEMYIFSDDRVGRQFYDAMCRKAAAGCDVRVIYDAMGCLATPSRFFTSMRDAGVKVQEFNPFTGSRLLRKWRSLDRRNHRKMLVVDDRIAYVGGINVAAELVDWEDAHVRLEGRLARFARNSFEKVWHGSYPRVSLGSGRHQSLHRYRTLLLDGFPSPQFSRIKRAYLHLFSRARRRIRIIHAYLIPDRKVIRALKKAVRRGVDVEVIVPATSDVRAADWARAHVLARLLRHGIAVRRLAEPMLHTKAALADDRYVIVGSANLNRNSFFRNLEIVAWSHDMRLIEPIRLRFDMLWDKAVPYTLADHLRQSLWRRVQAWAAFRLQFLLPADQAW